MIEDFYGEPSDVFAPGEVNVLSPPELPYSGRTRGNYDLAMFDPILFDKVAASMPSNPGQTVRLTGHRPVSAAAANQLSELIDYLRNNVLTNLQACGSELIAATAASHLAASVLAAFPNNASTDPTAVDRHDSTPTLLRRATTFVDENAHTDIALADIAVAACVTPRALQYMFRRHLDCTPMQYVRRVRLHHAHRELVASDPTHTTVTAVANRWGFLHTGRFAVMYRRAYGRSPHETLQSG